MGDDANQSGFPVGAARAGRPAPPARIGAYRLMRRLADGPMGERHLALHEQTASNHVIALLERVRLQQDRGRVEGVLNELTALRHAHVLAIEEFGFEDDRGRAVAWTASPYTGDVDGLVTLASLLKKRGGYLPPMEARTAIIQVLQATSHAHVAGFRHGPLALEQIQVDRRGSLAIEHYGLAMRLMASAPGPDELERRELVSVLEMAYQLVTGLAAEDPLIRPGRMVPDLDPIWEDWFQTGLIGPRRGRPGFRSAAHALSAISASGGSVPGTEGALALFKRVSRLMTPRM